MGLTQTKLHHRVLQENWAAICRRIQTDDGKRWVRIPNPCGDYPLHLACYGGQAPPIVIRALCAAYPEALHVPNQLGYQPLQLARMNYRPDHPFREEVLEYLEAYTEDATGATARSLAANNDGSEEESGELPPILDASPSSGGYDDIRRLLPQDYHTYCVSTVCVVCLEKPADHVVVPCGHQCLCGDCAQKVIGTKAMRFCPVGRCAIDSIVRVRPGGDLVEPVAKIRPTGVELFA